MSVLLLRLAGPMQSWGTQSRFLIRDTGLEPSKSGVVGLLCAALGRSRDKPVSDLAALKMGVRVDHEGRMSRDYHTAQKVIRANESGWQDTVVSQRYYLADADFLVGLEGDADILRRLDRALEAPVWPIYLGRKAFVPGEPVRLPDGCVPDMSLEESLRAYPWRPRRNLKERPPRLRLVLETPPGQGEPRYDVPICFASREFTVRYVHTGWLNLEGHDIKIAEPSSCI